MHVYIMPSQIGGSDDQKKKKKNEGTKLGGRLVNIISTSMVITMNTIQEV